MLPRVLGSITGAVTGVVFVIGLVTGNPFFVIGSIVVIGIAGIGTALAYGASDEKAEVRPSNSKAKPVGTIRPQSVKKITPAYIKGYRDMAEAANLKTTKTTQVRDPAYVYATYYIDKEVDALETVNGVLRYPEENMRDMALKWREIDRHREMYAGYEFNYGNYMYKKPFHISNGQKDRDYLGGSEEEFQDYYAGGMKFIEHWNDMKAKLDEEEARERVKDQIIEARRKGLKEINIAIEEDLTKLNEMRQDALSPDRLKKRWDEQMKEIGNV